MDWGKIGLGTFPLCGVFRPLTEDQVFATVDRFVDLGGQYIETAPLYPRSFDAKKLLARYNRSDIVIATKCVTGPSRIDGKVVRSGASEHINWQVDVELSRLGIEYIDLLQAHITPQDVESSEFLDTIEALIADGKVKAFGVSNVNLEQLKALNARSMVSWAQNRLSMIHQSSYSNISKYCVDEGISINCYQAIERGQLLFSSSFEGEFLEDDLRSKKPEYLGEPNKIIREWFSSLAARLEDQYGLQPNHIALGWALSQPAVGMAVVGATSGPQIEEFLSLDLASISDAIAEVDKEIANLRSEIREEFGLTVEEFRGLAA